MHYMHPSGGHQQTRLPLFATDALSHQYPDGRIGLRDVSLCIFDGDRIALVGQNGSGKTTLVKHLNGIFQPTSGSLRYRGDSLVGTHLSAARLEIGVLFQDPDDHLFCNTLYDDVAFGPMNQGLSQILVEERVLEAVTAVGLLDLLYKPAHLLSYGQKKRAALAAVLAMKPQVLILDEPTANLDPRQERIFKELLGQFEGTLICISHDLLFLYDLCERAVVLSEGRVHHDFSLTELVSQRAALREHGLDFSFRFSCCAHHGPHHHEHVHVHEHGGGVAHVHPHAHAHQHPVVVATSFTPAPMPPEKTPLVELVGYSFRYPDGSRGIIDIDLTVLKGDSIALVGENGAGKSTLCGCLMGILEGHGVLRFDGTEPGAAGCRELWRRVGMVFQNSADQLFCPSCREEVAFGPRQMGCASADIEQRVVAALAMVRLSGYEQRVPQNMSGGERKRLAIAAVLSMQPEVLILDEPTAGLDPASEELLLEILASLPITTILVTHDLFFITRATRRTVVMHQGRIIRDYATAEFINDEHLQAENALDYTYKNDCGTVIMALQDSFGMTAQEESNLPE